MHGWIVTEAPLVLDDAVRHLLESMCGLISDPVAGGGGGGEVEVGGLVDVVVDVGGLAVVVPPVAKTEQSAKP